MVVSVGGDEKVGGVRLTTSVLSLSPACHFSEPALEMAFNKLVVYSLVLRVRSECLCHQELLVTKKQTSYELYQTLPYPIIPSE